MAAAGRGGRRDEGLDGVIASLTSKLDAHEAKLEANEQVVQVLCAQTREQQSLLETLLARQAEQASELRAVAAQTALCAERLRPIEPAFAEVSRLMKLFQERLAGTESRLAEVSTSAAAITAVGSTGGAAAPHAKSTRK